VLDWGCVLNSWAEENLKSEALQNTVKRYIFAIS